MSEGLRGKFLRVVCTRCGNRHVLYGKCVTKIKCAKCNRLLVKTTGGKTVVRALVKDVF